MTYKDVIGITLFGIPYLLAEALHTLVWLPEKIRFKKKITKQFKEAPLYISLEEMKYYDLGYYNKYYTEVPYFSKYNKYKQYIFDENNNKAILMANKHTGELAYVINNEVICKDIDKHKLNLDTSAKNRLNKLKPC